MPAAKTKEAELARREKLRLTHLGKPSPNKGKHFRPDPTIEEIEEVGYLYKDDRLTKREIGEKLGLSWFEVTNRLSRTGLILRSRSEEYSLSYHRYHPSILTTVTLWERGFIEGLYFFGFNGVEIQKLLKSLWGKRLDIYTILKEANFPIDSASEAARKRVSKKTKDELGEPIRKYWKSLNKKVREERIIRFIEVGCRIKLPTTIEAELLEILDKVCPNEYKYTGDRTFMIGRLCPDFVNVNGQKKVIEAFGDYWHRNDNPQNKIEQYKKYGFDCLVLWEKEIKDKSFRTELENTIVQFNQPKK